MPLRFPRRIRTTSARMLALAAIAALAAVYVPASALPRAQAAPARTPFCGVHAALCTETAEPWNYQGIYTGHDEPSVLYYSNVPGSGNSDLYQLTLPTDPPTLPAQDGSGGTWNFQLHPAFWFGMALCDNQSAPLPGAPCAADSDSNIFNSTNPASAKYMGKHPGTAFMEMQFYPPGWDSFGCTQTRWCASLNIDSFSSNSSAGTVNNADCLNRAGEEYVNFAFITKNGVPVGPPDPLDQTGATFTPNSNVLFFKSGDHLSVLLHDTAAGFQVVIKDNTTGQTGFMTASVANQFGHPLYQPSASSCTDQFYSFHPMYSTSSPETRVLWAAHSYNVAYSDEIGHFEYCAAQTNGACTAAGVSDPSGVDGDDAPCLTAPAGTPPHTVPLTGCFGTDVDFDSPDYFANWPGTNPNAATDASLHAAPVVFTSPLFIGPGTSGLTNYARVAFENDLPRIEFATSPPCQRHISNPADPNPGAGCVDPAPGTTFYPFYTTGKVNGQCVWQEGGAYIPGTTNTFGGSPTAEYGGLLPLAYPAAGNTITMRYNDFRNVLSFNPCPA